MRTFFSKREILFSGGREIKGLMGIRVGVGIMVVSGGVVFFAENTINKITAIIINPIDEAIKIIFLMSLK